MNFRLIIRKNSFRSELHELVFESVQGSSFTVLFSWLVWDTIVVICLECSLRIIMVILYCIVLSVCCVGWLQSPDWYGFIGHNSSLSSQRVVADEVW